MMACASASVEESGKVGPDATISGDPPGTSEKMSPMTVAGESNFANPPPLSAERCLRTVFNSWMESPARKDAA